jgi:hypothetical protein
MNISVGDVETGVVAQGAPGTPVVLAATGLTSSASQSFNSATGSTVTSSGTSKNHHHE